MFHVFSSISGSGADDKQNDGLGAARGSGDVVL